MIVIPAIDLKDGKCVRLEQGKMDKDTVYGDNPAEMAQKWVAEGAERLHVVDLNGAFAGEPKNLEAIKAIVAAVKIPVQVGGGIRDIPTMERLFDLGVERLILGTSACRNPELVKEACEKFPDGIIAGIDASNGRVAIKGWAEVTVKLALNLAKEVEEAGVCAIIYTDISRDGMMQGPNLDAIRRMADSVNIPIIASGGVSSLRDIRNLKILEVTGVAGVITGKAIYSGALDLKQAIKVGKGEA